MKKSIIALCFLLSANIILAQWQNGTDMYNLNTGNVGIGTSSSLTQKLTLNGNMQLWDFDNSYYNRYIKLINSFYLQTTSHGSNNWNRGNLSHNVYFDNTSSKWEVGGGTYNDFAAMRFENGGTIGFYTRTNTGSAYNMTDAEMGDYSRMTILYDGNVGIGNTFPGYKLDVNGNTRIKNGLYTETQSSGAIAGWFRGMAGNGNIVVQSINAQAWWITGADGVMKIGGNGGSEPSTGVINIDYTGKVGIGTATPGSFKLAVEGKIGAREVQVITTTPWPDYVFQPGYKLLPIAEVEKFIKKNSHLPDVPSAAEVKDGVELGRMTSVLLQKIEEMTLYIIELKKENTEFRQELENIRKQLRK